MTDNDDIRTIKDTNAYLSSLVETPETVKDYFWIGGNVTYVYTSHLGHTYFTITDEQHSISCMLPNRHQDKAIYLKKDTMIDVYGVLQVYQKEAKLQMMVSDVRIAELDESTLDVSVLEQLEAKGLFPRTRQDLPQNPEHISLITSKNSEALRDFKYVYQEQKGNAAIEVMDTLVQGDQAPKLIAQRIREANHHKKSDIIVLTRGGGRHEDLSTFNSIEIAEAICNSQIPVVTGIGHQRNETIADRVADQSTISPTDAAYKLAQLSGKQIEYSSFGTPNTPDYDEMAHHDDRSKMILPITILILAIIGVGAIIFIILQFIQS